MKRSSLSIRQLVLGFLLVLTLINILSVGAIFLSMSSGSVAIDVAGRNRMLSQRMALYARLYMDGNTGAKQVCKAAVNLHELSLLALKYGGDAPGMEEKTISAATGEAAEYLRRVEQVWEKYKGHLQVLVEQPLYTDSIITVQASEQPLQATDSLPARLSTSIRVANPKLQASVDFISSHATAMLEVNDALVKAYVRQAQATEQTIHLLLLSGIALSLVVLALGYHSLNKVLFNPLDIIAKSSAMIAKGDYSQTIHYSWENELTLLASSLNVLFGKLSKASLFVAEFGKGNYRFVMEEFTTDENYTHDRFIKSLIETQAMLKETDEKNKQRTWASVGFTQVGDLVRNHQAGITPLARRLIVHLTCYLDANQGGIFLVNEQDSTHPYLELAGCYAYSREKFITKRVEIGEGLLGEVYLEGVSKYLLEIPQHYTYISSGLGEATPKSMLIVPLKLNEKVHGVMELASFSPFEPYQIEFIEKIAETIAATIASMQTGELTRRLYEQAHQQAEELRAQEEEMRQNMEELEATQEEMRRTEVAHLEEIKRLEGAHQLHLMDLQKKELERKGFLAAVDATLVMIEFDLDGTILSANGPFLQAMGYSLQEICGQHHRLFVEMAYSQSEEYSRFWQQLKAGIAQVGEVKRITKEGQPLWLSASYTPVFNEDNRVVKIIKFAQDITGQKITALDYQSQLVAISKSNAVVEFDLQGHILTANENFLSLMNYSLPEIKGMHHRLFVAEDQRQSREYSSFWEKLRGGEYISGEFERIAKDGKRVWIKGSYNPIQDLSGKVYKIVKYAQDMTTQKQLERQALDQISQLQAQEEEIRQNLEELQATGEEVERKSLELQAHMSAVNSSMATIEFDLQGTILKANENFLQLMGYSLNEIINQHHRLFVEAAYAKSSEYDGFWQALRSGKAQIGQIKRLTKTGNIIHLNASYTPVFDLNNKPVKIIKLAQVIETTAS